jgi:hypothetical protein
VVDPEKAVIIEQRHFNIQKDEIRLVLLDHVKSPGSLMTGRHHLHLFEIIFKKVGQRFNAMTFIIYYDTVHLRLSGDRS